MFSQRRKGDAKSAKGAVTGDWAFGLNELAIGSGVEGVELDRRGCLWDVQDISDRGSRI